MVNASARSAGSTTSAAATKESGAVRQMAITSTTPIKSRSLARRISLRQPSFPHRFSLLTRPHFLMLANARNQSVAATKRRRSNSLSQVTSSSRSSIAKRNASVTLSASAIKEMKPVKPSTLRESIPLTLASATLLAPKTYSTLRVNALANFSLMEATETESKTPKRTLNAESTNKSRRQFLIFSVKSSRTPSTSPSKTASSSIERFSLASYTNDAFASRFV